MEKTFRTLNNIETSFKKLKILTFSAFGLCIVITITAIIASLAYAEKQRQKIYVLDEGKSLLLALQTDKVANKEIEAADHVKRFHELFFTLAPNVESIENNINSALNFADRRAYEIYTDLQEQGYYSRLISASMSQSIIIDSIRLNTSVYPYLADTYARIFIVRSNSITTKKLNTTCQLINTARSESNPHGLLLEKFEILDNTTIKESRR